MNTENLSTLKIHKLTQAQYDRELAAGNIDENALYFTPDEEGVMPIDWFSKGIAINANDDLDTYITDGKYYGQDIVSTLTNCPTTYNFALFVFVRSASSNKSHMLVDKTGRLFIRSSTGTAWGDWKEYATTNELTSLTDSLETVAINKADKSAGVFYIEGTGDTAGAWVGSHDDITEYYPGLMVAYKANMAGVSGGATLNINGLGAVPVVRNATTAVTTTYAATSIIFLTYTVDTADDGTATPRWKIADYDANSDAKTSSANKTEAKMYVVGATSQSSSGKTTYTNKNCYIGTDNCLYSNGKVVATAEEVSAVVDALTATDVGARPDTWTPTATDVGADPQGTAQSKADAALASAKAYTNQVKDDLLNGAGPAYDTLGELANLINENQDALQALETVATGKADKSTGVFYIEGTGETAGVWTGEHDKITEYYPGLMVAYKPNIAGGSSSTTLNINGLGAVAVSRNVSTAVTTTYGVNSVIFLTYTVDTDDDGTTTPRWKVADYDSDTKTSSTNKTGSKMYILAATSQSSTGKTSYSNKNVYIGTDNCLYSGGKKVATSEELSSAVDALTAEDVGAVDAAGGIMTGNLTIQHPERPILGLQNTTLKRSANVQIGSSGTVDVINYGEAGDAGVNNLGLRIAQESGDITDALKLFRQLNGSWEEYAVYHEGNKPTVADIGAFGVLNKSIPSGDDLDNYFDQGSYYITGTNASGVANVPRNTSLQLYVFRADAQTGGSDTRRTLQIATPSGIPDDYCEVYYRKHSESGWSSWKQIATTDKVFGHQTGGDNFTGDLNDCEAFGAALICSEVANRPPNTSVYGTVWNIFGNDYAGYLTQFYVDAASRRCYYRNRIDGVWDGWNEFLHTGNKHLISVSEIGGLTFKGSTRTEIPAGSDLNNIITLGNYVCSGSGVAQGLSNCPTATAFRMEVVAVTGGSDVLNVNSWTYIEQRIQDLNGYEYKRFVNTNNDGVIHYGDGWITAINSNNIGSQAVNWANSANAANSAGNAYTAANADPAASTLKNIRAGTSDIGAGASLATGEVYFVYE